MHSFEIEIKSLLGSKEKADELYNKMKVKDPNLQILGSHKQLNHYFIPNGGNLVTLFEKVKNIIEKEKIEKFQNLAQSAKDFSVRTRDADGKIILVIKASVDDTTSSNGTARLELESMVNLKLDELDNLILDSGFKYQAKWSRERQEFNYSPTSNNKLYVTIDKNAGYGYLAEFEKQIENQEKANEVKQEIRSIMQDLNITELAQDRLERMFKHYNENWQDYYGTEKIFVID